MLDKVSATAFPHLTNFLVSSRLAHHPLHFGLIVAIVSRYEKRISSRPIRASACGHPVFQPQARSSGGLYKHGLLDLMLPEESPFQINDV